LLHDDAARAKLCRVIVSCLKPHDALIALGVGRQLLEAAAEIPVFAEAPREARAIRILIALLPRFPQ
jgi:hypothetical protein